MFQECFKGVSRECPWCFEGVSRVFHGSGKGVLRVSGMFQGHVYLGVVNHVWIIFHFVFVLNPFFSSSWFSFSLFVRLS